MKGLHLLADRTRLCGCLFHWLVCSYSVSLFSLYCLTVLLITPVCGWSPHQIFVSASLTTLSLSACVLVSLVAPVCEVWNVTDGWKLWDSSGTSQKPLYSKLENYSETQDKSPNSILRLLPSYTSTKVVSGVSSKRRTFSIRWILWRNLIIINT